MARLAGAKSKKPGKPSRAAKVAKKRAAPAAARGKKTAPARKVKSAAKSSPAASAKPKKTSKAKSKPATKTSPKKRRNVQLFVLEPEKVAAAEPEVRYAPWPCAHANARRTGATSLAYAPPVALAWEAKLPGDPRTAPVVADDGSLYAADSEGNLLAFDATTGRELWRFHTDPVAPTSPARPLVDEGVVPGNRVPVASPPCVLEWRLFFGDDEGVLYSLRRGDATVNFRRAANLSLAARSQAAFAAPVAAGGIVYAADSDGTLHAVSTEGPELWSRVLRGRVSVPPALAPRHVLVATHPLFPNEPAELHALEVGTGERLWHSSLPGLPRALVALDDAALVLAGDQLLKIELATGKTLLQRSLDVKESVASSLATDGGHVFATLDGGLVALDVRTLEERWRARLKRPIEPVGAPAVSREHVWQAARDGLVAVDKASGREVARVRTRGVPATGVVLAAGKVFVATEPKRILAFRAR